MPKKRSGCVFLHIHFLAEREGFEPPVPRSTTVFKTAAIDHSAISPELLSRSALFQKRCKGTTLFYICKLFWSFLLEKMDTRYFVSIFMPVFILSFDDFQSLEDLGQFFHGHIHLFFCVGSHECKTKKCILWCTCWWNYWVDEYAFIESHLG